MIAGVAGGLWLAVMFMINPDAVTSLRWIQALLPDDRPSGYLPQTPSDIQASLEESDRFAGTPLLLPGETPLWLVPVAQPQSHCLNQGTLSTVALPTPLLAERWDGLMPLSLDCQQIVELRLYRPLPQRWGQAPRYEQLHQVAVSGPSEFRVAMHYSQSTRSVGSNTALPLHEVTLLGETGVNGALAPEGIWLTLQGQWQRGDRQTLYGQVVHYDPTRQQLRASVVWVSPQLTLPTWTEVTGNAPAELVVNQTVGLEPDFEVFQINPAMPGQLQPISLLEQASDETAYAQAIALTQAQLWSPALVWMERAQTAGQWSDRAQAQMDVIALHAQVTRRQAEQTWSTPGQALTALILDGRWQQALTVLEQAAPEHQADLRQVVASSMVWGRVNAALRVQADDDVQTWGVLAVAARQGRQAAIAWFQTQNDQPQPVSTEALTRAEAQLPERLRQLLNRIAPTTTPAAPPSASATAAPVATAGRLIGLAQPVAPGEDVSLWSEAANRRLNSGGAAYEVLLSAFDPGDAWQRSPYSALGNPSRDRLQELLGIVPGHSLDLLRWNSPDTTLSLFRAPQSSAAQVLDLRADGDRILALVEGQSTGYALATSRNSLTPLAPDRLTLAELQQQFPQLAQALTPAVDRLLQEDGRMVPTGSIGDRFPQAVVALAEVTGDGQADLVLRLTPQDLRAIAPDARHSYTLVVRDDGTVLYSEIGGKTSTELVAIAQLQGEGPVLILDSGDGYQLRLWTDSSQQFE